MNPYVEYMREIAQPMRDELVNAGFTELTTPDEVQEFFKDKDDDTTLVVINSVCGCAAGLARPAAIQSVEGENRPDHLVTVFAGQDRDATFELRCFFPTTEPSSPSIALLKGTELVHFLSRDVIENSEVEDLIQNLEEAYKSNC